MSPPSRNHHWIDATLNAVATPIVVADTPQRLILFANRAAVGLIGSEAVGVTVGEAFGLHSGFHMTDSTGRLISREHNPVKHASQGESVGPIELLWHRRGEVVVLVCYAEQIPPTDEEPAAIVLSLFDVTQMRKLQRELAKAETARDEFVHLAAHELRTPLTSLRLQVELARRRHSGLPEILAVGTAVDRVTKRVEQLIDVADMRKHLVALHPERVDLLDIVGEAVGLMAPQAGWAKCSMTIGPSPPIFGNWDRPRLIQVIASLLSNAVRFGPGKPVEIVPRDDGPEAEVRVVDHGIGIKPLDREVIFERFQRQVSSAHFGGLGLDLWITREILRQMKGSIHVEDTPNGGATMIVRLPKGS